MNRRFFLGRVEPLADDEVAGVAITGTLARDGDVWDTAGIDLSNYRSNPIVLWSHDPTQPVGTASAIGLTSAGSIGIVVRFAPPGVSAIADEVRGLVKGGVVTGFSAGINPTEVEPLDPRNPRSGVRITKSELLEVSFVSIPADASALVQQRSHAGSATRRSAIRGLPPVHRDAQRTAAAMIGATPLQQRLAAVAREFGRSLPLAQLDRLAAEARAWGKDPVWWLEHHLVRHGAVRR